MHMLQLAFSRFINLSLEVEEQFVNYLKENCVACIQVVAKKLQSFDFYINSNRTHVMEICIDEK